MPKTLEGFVDDGRAAPLPDITAVVTVVGDGAVVATGLSGADGHWFFDGLADDNEYFVNLVDVAGNAIVRGPWSGEVRDVWVRDRLSLSSSGVADLPNGGRTLVGGLPVALSDDGGNLLEWRADGFYTAGTVGLSQELADSLYEPIDSAYTKVEADARYAALTDPDPFPQYLTTIEGDARYEMIGGGGWLTQAAGDLRYEPLDSAYTKAESDGRYPLKTDLDPYPSYLTAAEADALFLTPAEGNAAYATAAHNHDTNYVQLTGGSVMTGLLGPTSNNTRDLGTTALRWRKLWAVDGEFTNAPTVGGSALLTATAADALFLTPAEGNTAYATAAHAHTAAYVDVGGDTMTGDLIVSPGKVGIGITSPTPPLHLGNQSGYGGFWLDYASSLDPYTLDIKMRRARNTLASPQIVTSGDNLGSVQFWGYDGGAYRPAVTIIAEVGGTPGASDMPGTLTVNTTADGAAAPTERVRVDSTGLATFANNVRVNGNIGFYNTAPIAKPTVTGSRGSNAALTSLLTALANLGLVVNSSS